MRIRNAATCIAAAAIGFTVQAAAASPPDAVIPFPAGTACAFDLSVELRGGDQQHYKEFLDKNGNVVRSISAGKGSALTFINDDTGATLSLKANGFSDHQMYNSDGTITDTTMGHVVLLLATTDFPPGPSTTLYVGRLVLTIDPTTDPAVYTFQSFSGKATDICAALD